MRVERVGHAFTQMIVQPRVLRHLQRWRAWTPTLNRDAFAFGQVLVNVEVTRQAWASDRVGSCAIHFDLSGVGELKHRLLEMLFRLPM